MAFERVALFGIIDVDLESTGAGTLYLSTDVPGVALSVRETKAIAATSRRPVRLRLKGTTQGHLYSLRIVPAYGAQMRIYGARIWARVLPNPWAWYPVPLIETGTWEPRPLPIPQTGDWAPRPLPIPPTGDWEGARLPIPKTEDWVAAQLPIIPTPPNPEWVEIPTDQ